MRICNAIILAMIMMSSLAGRTSSQERQDRCNKRLIDTISTNSISKVKRALNLGGDVNCVIDVYIDDAHSAYRRLQKTTPLVLALEGHWSGAPADSHIIKLLIHRGADVNGSDDVEETVLGAATRYLNGSKEHQEILRLLLSEGADVNKTNKQGFYPLNIAIGNLKPKLVQILLEYPHEEYVIKDAWAAVERMQTQIPEQVAEIAGMLSVYSIKHGITVQIQEDRPIVHVEQYIPSNDRAMKCDALQICSNTIQQARVATSSSHYKKPVSKCAPCKELIDVFTCEDTPFWEIDCSKAIHVPAQVKNLIDWHEIFGVADTAIIEMLKVYDNNMRQADIVIAPAPQCKSTELHEIFSEQTDDAEFDQMTAPAYSIEFVPCKELIDALSCEDTP